MNISESIRFYRKEANLSQKELGSRLGISQQMIAQYENGVRVPKIETINNIAGALGIGMKRLYPNYREEWVKTKTYHDARQNSEIREHLLEILTILYGDIKTTNDTTSESSFDINYIITINNKTYTITIENLNKFIEYLELNIPFLLDILSTNTKAPTN